MRAHLFLYEEVDPTREDLASVAQWLRAEPDQIEVHIKHEPIDKFLGQIKEMHGTFGEFPKDERRTNKILRLLKQGATPMPMYVEQGDKDLFVMEGRHRMVAFWLAGMKTVPVAYASKKLDETINPDILNKKFNHTQVIGDYTYKASVEIFMDEPLLNIKAYDGNKEIGHIMFEIFDWEDDTSSGYMESGGTEVDPKYRNKGVASTMYAYAKMLGNDIRPSFQRTTAGRGMWDAWKKSGEAQHLVAEDSYTPPTLHTGDKILKGKFKNSPAEIKGFKKDKHNQPVLKTNKGDIQLFKPRVTKLMKEEINPDILDPHFSDEQEIGDYRFTANMELAGYSKTPQLVIRCYDGETRIGEVKFYSTFGDSLVSSLTTVSPSYQKQGIASTMYAYARMLGNTIEPSKTQLPPGKKMWKSWKKAGDAEHLMKESLDYQGNCTEDDIIEHIFGDVNNFANLVDEHGDEFEIGDLVVKYDPETDVHSFYYKTPDEKLNEYEHGTDNSKQIFSKLEGLGYKKLGSGQDATVWAKDENHVIKILMPRRTLPSEVANAELGFITFYDFCKKHPELPNLPRFIDIGGQGHTVFEINGTSYRQIAMERLQQIPRGSFEEGMVWMLADLSKYGASWPNLVHQMKNPVSWTGYSGPLNMAAEVTKQFADQAVSTRYGILSVTMGRLYRAGLKSGLGWDLHTENAMLRPDGTIVIVDPFYT